MQLRRAARKLVSYRPPREARWRTPLCARPKIREYANRAPRVTSSFPRRKNSTARRPRCASSDIPGGNVCGDVACARRREAGRARARKGEEGHLLRDKRLRVLAFFVSSSVRGRVTRTREILKSVRQRDTPHDDTQKRERGTKKLCTTTDRHPYAAAIVH